jgi:hypothetical protein
MTSIIAISVAAAGLIFSLAVALLIEELIFGAIFSLFFRSAGRSEASVKQIQVLGSR